MCIRDSSHTLQQTKSGCHTCATRFEIPAGGDVSHQTQPWCLSVVGQTVNQPKDRSGGCEISWSTLDSAWALRARIGKSSCRRRRSSPCNWFLIKVFACCSLAWLDTVPTVMVTTFRNRQSVQSIRRVKTGTICQPKLSISPLLFSRNSPS